MSEITDQTEVVAKTCRKSRWDNGLRMNRHSNPTTELFGNRRKHLMIVPSPMVIILFRGKL